jgi:(1->4)-alpha-D-glucan 1-alpha-D-glucosylmutase
VPGAVPTATYRLQLHAGFGFDAARTLVPYLERLGVSHLYLSPVLQAATGSLHGYDVVDHSRISAELGGRGGLDRLAEEAHAHGLGVVVDVVPNHMALVAPEHANRALWETLRLGSEAPTSHWFDVDWEYSGGRFPLPLLGDTLEAELAAGTLTLDVLRPDEAEGLGGQPVLRYHDHAFPLAPGSVSDRGDSPAAADVRAVLDRQHYLLASWRDKDEVLAYRRFFDVDSLVAVRVELPDVFDATHAVLVELYGAGVVDGFRIDHPDGLADPEGYLDRLRDATAEAAGGRSAWVVVEKILEGDEALPDSWACAGTTGYDALRAVQQSLVPPTSDELEEIWSDADGRSSLAEVQERAKREVVDGLLQPELRRLTRVAVRACADAGEHPDPERLAQALTELLVQVDVYRCYVRPGHPVDPDAAERFGAAAERAHTARPDLTAELVVLERLLLDATTASEAGRDLVVRFQQTCGPVMAKGVEDTTFYRWYEMVGLAEVGGDPGALEDPSVSALHGWARRQAARHPHGMTTLSTHDTKRSEDVRARLLAAAGDPAGWRAAWVAVRTEADRLGVDRPTAYLVLQTLLGTWPIEHERLEGYVVKATREAKRRTTWIDPAEEYEGRVVRLARTALDDPSLCSAVSDLVEASAGPIRATVLAQKLLQLTLPGVPDVYQGCEAVDLSLVDPDNRRPVHHDELHDRLERLDGGGRPHDLDDEKLLVTSRALRLRRAHPAELDGTAEYEPLRGTGPHLVAFRRGPAVTLATRWPTRLATGGGWGEASVVLPDATWTDQLTGRTTGGGRQRVADLLADLPVALLTAGEETS